jgi:hypothetical protein
MKVERSGWVGTSPSNKKLRNIFVRRPMGLTTVWKTQLKYQ